MAKDINETSSYSNGAYQIIEELHHHSVTTDFTP